MTKEKPAEAIYEDNDFYVPYFKVKIDNKEIEKQIANDIISVSYKDNLTDIDSFELTINNWDTDRRAFKYIGGVQSKSKKGEQDLSNIFMPGKDIEVWMGYYYKETEKIQRMLFGEITTLEPNFPASGSPVLNVRGLNLLHRLRDKQRTESYRNMRDSEIAEKITKRIGIKFTPIKRYKKREEKNEFLFQDNKYDIVFLLERARTIGYELYIQFEDDKKKKDDIKEKKGELVFEPSERAKKTYLLEWGRSLINFRPTLTTANQVSKVVVIGWNPGTKSRVKGEAERKNLETRALGVKKNIKIIEKSLSQKIEIVAEKPVYTKREANRLAEEILKKIEKGMVKANGSNVGLPALKSGTYIEIKSLGDLFSGRYYVTETSHTINDSGYLTTFSARKEEKKQEAKE
jgi:phage protein D